MRDLNYVTGVLHVRNGGTGLTDVGAAGSVLTSDGVRATWTDQTTNPFTSASALFVDPVLGSDNNNGLQLAPTALATGVGPAVQVPGPLKTWTELRRRIGSNKLSAVGGVTITINGDLPAGATDPFIVDFGATVPVVIQFATTQTSVNTSRNSSASVNRNTATNTPYSMTDAGVTWANFMRGFFVAFTAGAALNAFAQPVKDNGGGSVRLSVNTLIANLAGVQMYDIRRMGVVNGTLAIPPVLAPTSGPSWQFTNAHFNTAPIIGTSLPLTFTNCQINASFGWSPTFAQLNFSNTIIYDDVGGGVSLGQCVSVMTEGGYVATVPSVMRVSNGSFLHNFTTWQSGGILAQANAFIDLQDAGFFDSNVTSRNIIDLTTGGDGRAQTLYGATAVANMCPMTLEPDFCNMILNATPTFLASAPARAVTVGTNAPLAAWPAVQGKTTDANSNAVLVHI